SFEFITEFGKQDLKSPNGIAIYGNFVYVSDSKLDEILKYELPDFKLVARIGHTAKGKLQYPTGMTSDTNGDLYLTEMHADRVSIFNQNLIFK
ncbi:hypothetical protein, partial [Salmonella sp. s51228]|uniref:hypothetical protein n=1 Tax=Salmonella sp. s51228 TaxID=3159652 RepID=UPI003980C248